MATTNQALITEAYQKIGVVREGQQAGPTQTANALTILNDNMATNQRDGWGAMGWYPQLTAQLSSNAPLKDEDIADVKLCLAAWIAPHYGVAVPTSPDPDDMSVLGNQIKAAFRRLNKRYLKFAESDLGELSRSQGGPWGGPNYI